MGSYSPDSFKTSEPPGDKSGRRLKGNRGHNLMLKVIHRANYRFTNPPIRELQKTL